MTSALTPEECLVKVTNFDLEKACLGLLFSKFVGYGIVAASFMLKVPQIQKILSKKSVEGISLSTFYLETLACTMNGAYGVHRSMPISTYGEQLVVSVQCFIQMFLYWVFGSVSALHKITVFSAIMFLWMLPLYGELLPAPFTVVLPEAFWAYIQIYNIIMVCFTKSTQIKENYSNGSTGNLSFITNFLQFAGCVTRIITTLTELNDPGLLANYGISTVLNGLIILQFWLYWTVKPKAE
jgi:mannose-P-dolichol utilization defect protein 1